MIMKKGKTKYTYNYKSVNIYFTPEERVELQKRVDNSTSRTINDYVRKATLGKPLVQYIRNKSIDDLIDECVLLRKEMETIREKAPLDSLGISSLLSLQQKIYYLIDKLVDDVRKN
jgi:hypothetical protein